MSIAVFEKHRKNETIFSWYLRTIIQFSKEVAVVTKLEQSSHVHLCSFAFIFLTDLNENINQHFTSDQHLLSISNLGWPGE